MTLHLADVDLVKYAFPEDVWFHVGQNTSSAHLYLRTQPWMGTWDKLPEPIVNDVAQLTKANSILGNKKDNVTIIYTPASNVYSQGDFATGSGGWRRLRWFRGRYEWRTYG